MTEPTALLLERIHAREARVGVVGLGYIGLPLAITFAEAGFPVTGIDVDSRRVERLRRGESPIRHIAANTVQRLVEARQLQPTVSFEAVRELDSIIICVPTPLTSEREPDMSAVIAAGNATAQHLRAGQLVVLESTTYPGTTDEVLRPLLEKNGLVAGRDFHLAFSPEREDPGNASYKTRTIPKLVGGHTQGCLEVAQALYSSALEKVVPVSSTRVAELAKLHENIFRAVNIALVNEMKMLCDRMGLDVWEVIQAASTKPFGFMPFVPGPGLGGHCIPIDPFYLTWKARQYEFHTRFIELAGEVNTQMPHYVVQRTMEGLNRERKTLNGARLLVLGVAYKRDVDDLRESPSLRIITLLRERGARVDYHDPYVPEVERAHGFPYEMHSVPLERHLIELYDAVLILTDHGSIDYAEVVAHANLVIDTRNVTGRMKRFREKIIKA
jgi:UDP-N-acetyl-D-glucosamine dehydrogenase